MTIYPNPTSYVCQEEPSHWIGLKLISGQMNRPLTWLFNEILPLIKEGHEAVGSNFSSFYFRAAEGN